MTFMKVRICVTDELIVSRDGAASISTGLQTGRPGNQGSIHGKNAYIFLFPTDTRPPLTLNAMEGGPFLPGEEQPGWGMTTTQLCLVPRLRLCGAVPPVTHMGPVGSLTLSQKPATRTYTPHS